MFKQYTFHMFLLSLQSYNQLLLLFLGVISTRIALTLRLETWSIYC